MRLQGVPTALKSSVAWYAANEVGYHMCVLAACAMQVGCKLPPSFKKRVKLIYTEVGLAPEAPNQLKNVLAVYRDGVPINVYSKVLHDTAATGGSGYGERDINYQNLEDVPTGQNINERSTTLEYVPFDFNHSVDTCGNCGFDKAHPGDGPSSVVPAARSASTAPGNARSGNLTLDCVMVPSLLKKTLRRKILLRARSNRVNPAHDDYQSCLHIR